MAQPPSKRPRFHLFDGQGNPSSSSTIPIGVFVTQDSFEEVKSLMSDSADFASFYAAALARQTSSSNERNAGDAANEKILSLVPAVRKIQDCGSLFMAAQYSCKLYADLEESYHALSKAFEVPLVVEFRTMSGQLIHTISESIDWASMRKMVVCNIEDKFFGWMDREVRNLREKRDEFVTKDPTVVRTMNLDTIGFNKLVPVLFEERTQRHVNQAGWEKGHCRKPCAKRDYVFRLVMAYNERNDPELLYVGHRHRSGNRVHPSGLFMDLNDADEHDYWPTLKLVDLQVPAIPEDSDEDDYRHVELGRNRTSIELKLPGRVRGQRADRADTCEEVIRFDGNKGAIALTKRCFGAISNAHERIKDIHAKVTEQFPTLQILQTLHRAKLCRRLRVVQGTEELFGRKLITELVDGCSSQSGNRMVLSWNVLVMQENADF